jgi:hypothetical protein
MVAAQAFKVVTEFKFEVAGALLGTEKLTSGVKQLSGAADAAINRFQSLGLSVIANLGLGGGGAFGLASAAVNASEKFRQAQLSLATVLSGNLQFFKGVDTFSERLSASRAIIGDIVKDARQFALPEKDLLEITKLLASPLARKGLAGDNLSVAREIGTTFLKTAPILGLDPGLATGQLLDLIAGQSSGQGRLPERLVAETEAFQKFGGKGGLQKFNKLQGAERINLLRTAFRQFNKDTEALAERVNSLGGQFTILRSIIGGINSILAPLGDVIKAPLITILKEVNHLLQTTGKKIIGDFTAILGPLISDPKKLFINLIQTKRLFDDLGRAKSVFTFAGIVGTLGFVLSKVTKIAVFAHPAIAILAGAFKIFADVSEQIAGPFADIVSSFLKWASIITIVGGITGAILFKFGLLGSTLASLGFFLTSIVAPALVALAVFQFISRAFAIAVTRDLQRAPELAEKFSGAVRKLVETFRMVSSAFFQMVDRLAEGIAPMLGFSSAIDLTLSVLDGLVVFLEKLTTLIIGFDASIAGLAFTVEKFMANIQSIKLADFFAPGNVAGRKLVDGLGDAFSGAFLDVFANAKVGVGPAGNSVARNVTNIDKITIENKFKEQQEPDRIAFTIKEQLMKAAQNPTQSRGRSIRSALTTSGAPA